MTEDDQIKFNEAICLLTEIRDFYWGELSTATLQAIENLLEKIENER